MIRETSMVNPSKPRSSVRSRQTATSWQIVKRFDMRSLMKGRLEFVSITFIRQAFNDCGFPDSPRKCKGSNCLKSPQRSNKAGELLN